MREYKLTTRQTSVKKEYGIAIFDCGSLIWDVPDLTDNKDAANSLLALLRETAAEPCHFDDILEDFLTDFKIE